ncbi:IQ and HECT domain protein [Xylona heveae TC161]|uniref:HECT-type E3 ubiquitin transferase n=1 Tax=Xylona heveae (strain CBS 132557 / TC161) TaxID=1328760 RepID=A0A165IH45_XYLHT|nr:IQ and HECT domain protein [Xylona heveae TC161]KZF24888.1 IQ and HECT domain protein [Xylona heveae TC161]
MFPSFTGTSRRPRQVNLSGRNPNPFASLAASRQAPVAQATLANAQQERIQRQLERERTNAARTLQRIWRGHNSRRKLKDTWGQEWEQKELSEYYELKGTENNWTPEGYQIIPSDLPPFSTDQDAVRRLQELVHFVSLRDPRQLWRMDWYIRRLLKTLSNNQLQPVLQKKHLLFRRFLKLCFRYLIISTPPSVTKSLSEAILLLLPTLAKALPKDTSQVSTEYYSALSSIIRHSLSAPSVDRQLLLSAVLAPLQILTSETLSAYQGFVYKLLGIADLDRFFGGVDVLASGINYKLLAAALAEQLKKQHQELRNSSPEERESRLWILGYFIYFHRNAHGLDQGDAHLPEPDYVLIVSKLLSSLADEVASRIQVEDTPIGGYSDREGDLGASRGEPLPLPPFVRRELLTLVNQQSISTLFNKLHESSQTSEERLARPEIYSMSEEMLLASYALTLLRVFPRRADEIRMWLYLGSVPVSDDVVMDGSAERIPAIKFFWQAVRKTELFGSISRDSRAALLPLKDAVRASTYITENNKLEKADQEWRIILLFFELYAFILKVMDDEEFFHGSAHVSLGTAASWTRQSALPLADVKDLTIFLKNLAFTMYWNASDIAESDTTANGSVISGYFSTSNMGPSPSRMVESGQQEFREVAIGGVTGMSLDYLKGVVTGLLRMVYERDSRRKFLPKDHWLMTSRFDMEGFIPAVVVEEENRHRLEEADDDDEENLEELEVEDQEQTTIIGTRRTQHARNLELLRKQQRKASRKKYLEAVTPRLEILQNMPFFIPFATRVQIFREFVLLDQTRRRGGHVDPDNWRMSIMQHSAFQRNPLGQSVGQEIISKHHAKIRRESVFEDAYEQFYELGEGLKEPIQITFVDKFDTVEAGIDGGGVTKEFLTSVTNEAFSPDSDLNLFVENDQSLLYPNPAAVDERREWLREAGVREGSRDWNEQIRDLLRRYEFLGRVIGKCLYEGILVDISFAPFFLLKWALTGGSGSAARESGYRANLNDLRDLDESLYQGLLQLKNYPGNVEDFALNFTVTDNITTPRKAPDGTMEGPIRTTTRDLRPGGSDIPVTNENRLVYISYMARHRLQVQPHLQTSAFLRGLGEIIPPSWLSMFNQSELQTLVGGASAEIDVFDLRRNTLYGGVYTIGDDNLEHPSVQLFWQVMQSLSDAERRKVLKFVTSTPRAPLLGFGQLNPRFSIRDAGDDQVRLPSTSTCVNLLKLPRYSDADTLREKLLYAVNSGAGFDLS